MPEEAPECCDGCRFYKAELINNILGVVVEADPNGCCNPFIDSNWCLSPHRFTIKGIFYETW
jgi:hypothetical protein